MKRTKKSFGDKIYLEWNDACERTGWQTLIDVLKVDNEVFCRTNAFYLGETKGFVIVAHTIGRTKANDVVGTMQIPKKWITKWK